MSITARPLFEATLTAITAATQYTTPAATKTIIDKFTATNTTGAAATLTVYIIPTSGVPSAANTIIAGKSLAAGECYTCPELVGHILTAGDFISVLSSVAGALTVRASGRELT
jgi:hypothetical protein